MYYFAQAVSADKSDEWFAMQGKQKKSAELKFKFSTG